MVIGELLRIEAAISMIQVAQMAQNQRPQFYDADKLNKEAKEAEEFISTQALKRGQRIVKYIYMEETKTEAPWDRRRRWAGWEI